METIFEALITDDDRSIALVGGGGKTSLMFYLARQFQQRGIKVISGTTTRILRPDPGQSPSLVVTAEPGFYERLERGLARDLHVTVAGNYSGTGEKLEGIDCSELEELFAASSAQRMVVEADGARQLPLKAAGEHEPVVCRATSLYVAVLGLDSIGKTLDEKHVFRAELLAERTDSKYGDPVSPLTIARLICHREGLFKDCPEGARRCIFLNKNDLPGGRDKAREVLETVVGLDGMKPDFWISASLAMGRCESGSMVR